MIHAWPRKAKAAPVPTSREERHGEFVAMLGDRVMAKYTDGGPSLKRSGQPSANSAKRERARLQSVAQRKQRALTVEAKNAAFRALVKARELAAEYEECAA